MAKKSSSITQPGNEAQLHALTRLASASTFDDFWPALDDLVRATLGHDTLLGTYRHHSYVIGPQGRDSDPDRVAALWALQHPLLRWEGKPGVVLLEPEIIALSTVPEPPDVMAERGWTHALLDAFWDEGPLIASFVMYRSGPFEPYAMQAWQRVRPICVAVAQRLARDNTRATQHEQTMAFMDDLPVGLVLLNERCEPVFVNREGYRQALMWNFAPDSPPHMADARELFRVPDDLIDLCREMTRQWYQNLMSPDPAREPNATPDRNYQVLRSGLKASISATPTVHDPLSPPSFLIRFHGMNVRSLRDFQPTPQQLALLAQLTPAERSTALLVGQGLSNQEIAQRLHREVSTVKDHLSRVYGKLGLRSRTQLARLLTQ